MNKCYSMIAIFIVCLFIAGCVDPKPNICDIDPIPCECPEINCSEELATSSANVSITIASNTTEDGLNEVNQDE